jgi:excinuclease ABC subunit B
MPGAPKEAATTGNRLSGAAASELAELIQELTDQMHAAAAELQFEVAARLRDEISGLKKELRQMQAATA